MGGRRQHPMYEPKNSDFIFQGGGGGEAKHILEMCRFIVLSVSVQLVELTCTSGKSCQDLMTAGKQLLDSCQDWVKQLSNGRETAGKQQTEVDGGKRRSREK